MKYLKTIILLVIFLFPYLVYAGCNPDNCSDVYVDMLYVNSNGTVYVATSGDESILNCNAVSNVYLTLPPDDVGSNRIFSTLLTAKSVNKKLTIQVDDNISGCVIKYIKY